MTRPLLKVRAFRFAISGALATGVHVAVAVAMLKVLELGPVVANGIAFAVATVGAFVVNTLWSFASRMDPRRFARFVVVSLVGCGVAMGVAAAAEAEGFGPWAGIGFVVMVVPPITFVLHNVWTYR